MNPIVYLISEPSALAINILEGLLQNFCYVKIFSNDKRTWKTQTLHITKSDSFEVIPPRRLKGSLPPDYLISCNLDPKDFLTFPDTKTFFIFSCKYLSNKDMPVIDSNTGIIYVDELVGPRMDFDDEGQVSKVIKAALKGEKVKIEKDKRLRPVFLGDVAKLVSKWLFSFGPFGEETQILGKEIDLLEVCQSVKKVLPGFSYSLSNKHGLKPQMRKIKTLVLNTNTQEVIEETVRWFKEKKRIESGVGNKKISKISAIFIPLLIILLTPVILVFVSMGLVFFAKESLVRGNLSLSRNLITVSNIGSSFAYFESTFLRIKPLKTVSYLLKDSALVALRGIEILENLSEFSQSVLGDQNYDIEEYSKKLASDLEYVSQKTSFLEGELKLYPNLYKKFELGRINKIIKNAAGFCLTLPDLLGKNAKKTYLVFLQNNMELRPTGGFIGSFALVSFDKGKLIDISVQDVYSADGQLKGHVEPPAPLKKYLGEANWFLRDSNWDPDFPKSAQKAEWFLDKELDVRVDGVVAVDLKLAKDLLGITGPIYLKDFQMEITAENLYEKTQSEVETDFFPGSVKKASFLTALSREMLSRLTGDSDQNYPALARVLFNNLEERHIQIFLHNNSAQSAISNIGWDGVFLPNQIGLVEANLGVNKANFFIKRDYFLDISANSRNLKIIYENSANPALGNQGIYKTYLRLVIPSTAKLTEGNESELYFEVLPGQKKEINFFWQEPLGNIIYWRKQAGTDGDNVTLTMNGVSIYNTVFLKDILWKNPR